MCVCACVLAKKSLSLKLLVPPAGYRQCGREHSVLERSQKVHLIMSHVITHTEVSVHKSAGARAVQSRWVLTGTRFTSLPPLTLTSRLRQRHRMAAHTSGIEVTQSISLDRSYTSPSSTWQWDSGRFISSPWSPFPLDRPQCREDKTVYHTSTGNASQRNLSASGNLRSTELDKLYSYKHFEQRKKIYRKA